MRRTQEAAHFFRLRVHRKSQRPSLPRDLLEIKQHVSMPSGRRACAGRACGCAHGTGDLASTQRSVSYPCTYFVRDLSFSCSHLFDTDVHTRIRERLDHTCTRRPSPLPPPQIVPSTDGITAHAWNSDRTGRPSGRRASMQGAHAVVTRCTHR